MYREWCIYWFEMQMHDSYKFTTKLFIMIMKNQPIHGYDYDYYDYKRVNGKKILS